MMGFVATGMVILVFLIALAMLLKECYRARVGRQDLVPRSPPTRRLSLDLPPRYSLVVNATTLTNTPLRQTSIIGPVRMLSTEEVQNIFIVTESPPDYNQALQQLEAKGVFFNPTLLKPMPPAYIDVAQSSDT